MNQRLLVCCLNIQEARNSAVISKVISICTNNLVKSFVDPLYNRSNLTFCGQKDEIIAIIDKIGDIALEEIEVNSPERVNDSTMHHHIGIIDNIPVHPLHNATVDDAAETAVGISDNLNSKNIPTLLYGAADKKHGKSLVQVRKATSFFERGQTKDKGKVFGHPKLGTSVVGAVPYVMSFNMVINTNDIARILPLIPEIRSKEHGIQVMPYKNVFQGENIIEIACNLTQPSTSGGCSDAVLNKVTTLTERLSLRVIHSYSTNPPFESILDSYLRLINGAASIV
jgi:glutamate formiminotransferase